MIEAPEFDIKTDIPVMEHFYTIQGEGYHSGRAAYFIRLAGCDVGCIWCDVKESWKVEEEQVMSIEELVSAVRATASNFVVITGGEPALYDLHPLTQELHALGCETAIETSGSSPVRGVLDWICLSPKKFKAPEPEVYAMADELKIIVYNKHDLKWAETEAQKVSDDCVLLLQPEWSQQEKMLPLMLPFVKEHPRWKISLQTHKYMNIP